MNLRDMARKLATIFAAGPADLDREVDMTNNLETFAICNPILMGIFSNEALLRMYLEQSQKIALATARTDHEEVVKASLISHEVLREAGRRGLKNPALLQDDPSYTRLTHQQVMEEYRRHGVL